MVSCCVLKCPTREHFQHSVFQKIAENWEWPRGGMVDTKDLKAVLTLLHIRSNF